VKEEMNVLAEEDVDLIFVKPRSAATTAHGKLAVSQHREAEVAKSNAGSVGVDAGMQWRTDVRCRGRRGSLWCDWDKCRRRG
jgi:hypothetical protein